MMTKLNVSRRITCSVMTTLVIMLGCNYDSVTAFQQPAGLKMPSVSSSSIRPPLFKTDHGQDRRFQTMSFNKKGRSPFPSNKYGIQSIGNRGKVSRIVLASGMADLHPMAWYSMTMLAFQFGTQPILVRKFAPKSICRSTVVLAQEVVKFFMAGMILMVTGGWASSVAGWSIREWWLVAGIPAFLYVVQNYCTLIAYQNLAPVTFNVLNQTKTLSAALCCFLVMGRAQSKLQVVSLFILLLSALVIEKVVPLPFVGGNKNDDGDTLSSKEEGEDNNEAADARKTHLVSGVVPILAASFISGLAGALVQKSLQHHGRNTYLFSMELAAASSFMLIVSLLFGSPDAKLIQKQGLSYGWTLKTWLPVFTNAGGGIVVGLVTKHAGAVRKGFALIFGLLLSGILQSRLSTNTGGGGSEEAGAGDGGVTSEQIVGGVLASLSLWMHAKFPYVAP